MKGCVNIFMSLDLLKEEGCVIHRAYFAGLMDRPSFRGDPLLKISTTMKPQDLACFVRK